jgi:flagellar assembly protein FliH
MTKIIKTEHATEGAYDAFEHVTLEYPDADALQQDPQTAVDEIMSEARAEAERKVKEAYAEGMRRGEEAGRARFEAQVAECAAALRASAEAMRQARKEFLNSLEPQLVALAVAVAERILHREIAADRETVRRTVRAATEHLAERERLTLRLNPGDHRALEEQGVDLLDDLEGVHRVRRIPDEAVDPGGCVVETSSVEVDATIRSQLEAILTDLLE